jgi:hypothetical protein
MMGDRRVATFFYGSFMDDNILKQLGVVAERSEVAVFVLRHQVGGVDTCVPGPFGQDASVGRLIGAWRKRAVLKAETSGLATIRPEFENRPLSSSMSALPCWQ